MDKDALRLELVRLTYTHGRLVTEAVARAQELEAYVVGQPAAPEKPRQKLGLKKPGDNPLDRGPL